MKIFFTSFVWNSEAIKFFFIFNDNIVVNVFEKNTPDVMETYTLWSILDEAQNKEEWWKKDMDAIKKTCMK